MSTDKEEDIEESFGYKPGEYEDFRSEKSLSEKEKYPFKFLRSESREPLTHISTSLSVSEISPRVREKMKMKNRDVELAKALMTLSKGDYKSFLKHNGIIGLFGPARSLIESCGRGDKVNKTEMLWELAWRGNLKFKEIKYRIPREECISCALDRDLSYAFYEITPRGERLIGYMGAACYNIRFYLLWKLILKTKKIAKLLADKNFEPGSYEFETEIIEPLQKSLDKIISAPKNMAAYRRRK